MDRWHNRECFTSSGEVGSNYHQLCRRFCKAANRFCLSITKFFQKSDVILSELSDIEEAPIILRILKIHKLTRCPPTATRGTKLNFFLLSYSKEPCCVQKYVTKKRYGHVDYVFDSLTQFRSTWMLMNPKND